MHVDRQTKVREEAVWGLDFAHSTFSGQPVSSQSIAKTLTLLEEGRVFLCDGGDVVEMYVGARVLGWVEVVEEMEQYLRRLSLSPSLPSVLFSLHLLFLLPVHPHARQHALQAQTHRFREIVKEHGFLHLQPEAVSALVSFAPFRSEGNITETEIFDAALEWQTTNYTNTHSAFQLFSEIHFDVMGGEEHSAILEKVEALEKKENPDLYLIGLIRRMLMDCTLPSPPTLPTPRTYQERHKQRTLGMPPFSPTRLGQNIQFNPETPFYKVQLPLSPYPSPSPKGLVSVRLNDGEQPTDTIHSPGSGDAPSKQPAHQLQGNQHPADELKEERKEGLHKASLYVSDNKGKGEKWSEEEERTLGSSTSSLPPPNPPLFGLSNPLHQHSPNPPL